jgi:hypothetical protein
MAKFRNLEASSLELPVYGTTVAAGEVITVPDWDSDGFQGTSWERVDPDDSKPKPIKASAAGAGSVASSAE